MRLDVARHIDALENELEIVTGNRRLSIIYTDKETTLT